MGITDSEVLLLVLALVLPLALLALGVALLVQGARRGRELAGLRRMLAEASARRADEPPAPAAEPAAPKVALVVNPIKIERLHQFRRHAIRMCRELGHGTPLWLETTVDDPGHGQALEALEDGAKIVIAAGGDGTVRSVAAALVGTDATMGIVPGGTGNLLARNIGVPLDDYDEALSAALTGNDRRIDVGWLRSGGSHAEASAAERDIFLIMAGLGFDAIIMEGTSDLVKKQFGWFAYVLSGARRVLGAPTRVRIWADDEGPHRVRARTVMLGNVGKLMGGIDLMPDASLTNGRFDALALNWRGLAGFGAVAAAVMNPDAKVYRRIRGLQRFYGTRFRVEAEQALPFELDGDWSGEARVLLAETEPSALTLRVPLGGVPATA